MSRKYALVDDSRCVACGACTAVCRLDAIDIYRGCYATINGEKCVGCGMCAKACPVGCIEIREREQNEK